VNDVRCPWPKCRKTIELHGYEDDLDVSFPTEIACPHCACAVVITGKVSVRWSAAKPVKRKAGGA